MKEVTEAQYRSIAAGLSQGTEIGVIAARARVSPDTVRTFRDGHVTSAIGMKVFEETTRPSDVTLEQHIAWLAQNGYRGFASTLRAV